MKYIFKINNRHKLTDGQYNRLPFGRQIEYRAMLENFKNSAKQEYLDCKGISVQSALKEFKRLVKPTEWFLIDTTKPNWKDDSILIYWK